MAGVTLYLQPTQDLTIDAVSGRRRSASTWRVDTALVDGWARRLVARLQRLPELRHVTTDAGATGLAAMVRVERDTAARLGVTASNLDNALYNAFGQRIVSTIFSETNQYRVILEAARAEDASLRTLRELPVRTSAGGTTPLEPLRWWKSVVAAGAAGRPVPRRHRASTPRRASAWGRR